MLYSSFFSSAVGPPHIPPCRIITMSPWGPTNAPCTSSTRGVDEEATTASSRRRRCSPAGLEPSTSIFTSRTGRRPPSSAAWTARTLQHQLDPESHSTDDPQNSGVWVWTVSSVQIPSPVNMNVRGSSRTEQAAEAVRRLPKQLSRTEWLHKQHEGSTLFWKCNYNRMSFILESMPGWLKCVCFFFFHPLMCRAALITLEL